MKESDKHDDILPSTLQAFVTFTFPSMDATIARGKWIGVTEQTTLVVLWEPFTTGSWSVVLRYKGLS